MCTIVICSGKNSIGYEIDSKFKDLIYNNINNSKDLCVDTSIKRIDKHKSKINHGMDRTWRGNYEY